MESTQNSLISELWTSEDNSIFVNDRMSDELKSHYERIFKEATYRAGIKSHLGFLTSGTTVTDNKSYKVVVISKEAFLESASAVNKYFILSPKDIWLQCLPRFHVGGMAIEARAHLAGFNVMKLAGHWNVDAFYNALTTTKATWSSLVPTQVYDLVHHQLNGPKKFRAFVGGGRISPQLLQQAKDLDWHLIPTYGLTELASTVATIENENLRFLSHVQYQIKNDRLCLRSKSLFTGYVQVIKGQVEFVKPELIGGYFTTDDMAQKVGANIMLLGRSQDSFKVSGELVSMIKLRDLWFRAIGLEKAPYFYLLSIPDARLENRIVLVMQKDEKYRDKSVLSHFHPNAVIMDAIKKYHENLLPFEKISGVFVIEQIPRTELGKVQEKLIQQQLTSGQIFEVKLNA
jgi:o-succinylbenzoate---CoA ligase